jgi:hypothetical protein
MTGKPTDVCQGSIPTRLFMRLFGETQRNEFSPSNLTLTEGIVPQLYWEAPIAGNVMFPDGVKLVVGASIKNRGPFAPGCFRVVVSGTRFQNETDACAR